MSFKKSPTVLYQRACQPSRPCLGTATAQRSIKGLPLYDVWLVLPDGQRFLETTLVYARTNWDYWAQNILEARIASLKQQGFTETELVGTTIQIISRKGVEKQQMVWEGTKE
jgi:hypothetical protein